MAIAADLSAVNAWPGSRDASLGCILALNMEVLMVRAALIALAGLGLAACASTTETAASGGGDRDCFRSEHVSGYSIVDDNHVRITIGASRNYILTTMFNARDLDWTHAIAIRSSTGFICTGNGLGVELIGGEPRRNYPISSIERAPDDPPPVQGS
jgi:hypothetical protein